ncbi:hypothetical protein ACO0LO_15640 [Undibacterium sp. TJN25]|uniref:hypothetical protein n=1 Tax=Undibacterium sp. TJN25 TaxID=3413056 RepID=UPI003BEF6F25
MTSGIVYPLAICELAKAYEFKNIGGTSAGAIAASAAAAAEYGRGSHLRNPDSFEDLAKLPAWLGEKGRLLGMFKPDAEFAPLVEIIFPLLSKDNIFLKAADFICAVLANFGAQLIILIALFSQVHRFFPEDLPATAKWLVLLMECLCLAMVFFVLVGMEIIQLIKLLPANGYGICSGFVPGIPGSSMEGPLTNWLTHYLNDLAGKPLSEGPLTFGDLYGVREPGIDQGASGKNPGVINLEMISTALNLGRPYRLPFQAPNAHTFYFSLEEFSKLFPREVVDHMVRHAYKSKSPLPTTLDKLKLYGFPEAENLPVIVATRMSLSFPLLLSAVPLHAVDRTLEENQGVDGAACRAERCWFSDGGISSNFPIQFFDVPIPMWPTFAINLKQFHPDYQNEEDAVWMPTKANSGWQVSWTRFTHTGISGMGEFLGAVVSSMQNWQDNTQLSLPGYRDRVVHVSLHDDEGGLNLQMPPGKIDILSRRGKKAGEMLVQRFGTSPYTAWNEHQWIRFRSCMSVTVNWVNAVNDGYDSATSSGESMKNILARPEGPALKSYQLKANKLKNAQAYMNQFFTLSTQWREQGAGFQSKAPAPSPELRIKPRI